MVDLGVVGASLRSFLQVGRLECENRVGARVDLANDV
jgi:hypothetical protein